jgi:hypothetical protein
LFTDPKKRPALYLNIRILISALSPGHTAQFEIPPDYNGIEKDNNISM